MKAIATLAGLLVVIGCGYFVYAAYFARAGVAAVPPQQQIDVTAIRSDLLVIGDAERQYVVSHGAYGTLQQLQQEGPSSIRAEVRGYAFSVEPNGAQSFTATAAPTDPSKSSWPTLTLDETMQVTQR